jgi:hypothetical protein
LQALKSFDVGAIRALYLVLVTLMDLSAVIFSFYDNDRDGSITRKDLLKMFRPMYKYLVDTGKISSLPADEDTPEKVHDNSSRCEYDLRPPIFHRRQLVNKIFGRLDKNHDAMINFDEFQTGYFAFSRMFLVSGGFDACRAGPFLRRFTAVTNERDHRSARLVFFGEARRSGEALFGQGIS